MPEHLIRLRGGWRQLDPDGEAEAEAVETGNRVTLPWTGQAGRAGRIRLVRSFGPPPWDPEHETLSLRLAEVGGLASARLNDREIARPTPGTTALDIPLSDPLPRRNLLVLDVDLPDPGISPASWGVIALVIRPREPSTESRTDRGPADPTAESDLVQEQLLGEIEPRE